MSALYYKYNYDSSYSTTHVCPENPPGPNEGWTVRDDSKYNGDAKNDFADVSSDNWSATYIASAKANGLIKGVSENEFAPLSAVTREDIAVILYRATLLAGKTYETKKENFTDFDDVSDYAKEAVAYMAGTGIINGFEDGSFNPKAPATRAQAAKLIYEALGKGE